jgi:L-lactate dehydrogenase (cytochrome)
MLLAKTSAETHSDGQDRLAVIDDSNLDQQPSDGASTRESQVAPVVADVTAPTHIVTILNRSAPATPRRFRDLLALDDVERYGPRLLPPMIHPYVGGAVETGASMRRAKAASEGLALLPRMLRDVSGRNQETELFGKTYASPSASHHWAARLSLPTPAIWSSPRRHASQRSLGARAR